MQNSYSMSHQIQLYPPNHILIQKSNSRQFSINPGNAGSLIYNPKKIISFVAITICKISADLLFTKDASHSVIHLS